jgi:PS-10 peptidase S37
MVNIHISKRGIIPIKAVNSQYILTLFRMKKIIIYALLIAFLPFQLAFANNTEPTKTDKSNADSAFVVQIKALPGVVDVEKLKFIGDWAGKYEITFLQAIDHQHPEKGTFLQRVFLNHRDLAKPMVVETEGYAAEYAKYPFYQSELSGIIGGNQVVIEHRYFGESAPEPINWDYLTVANAAADHHAVIETLNDLYTGKWISTGISKGGQTVMFHKSLYPDDVDFSVPYVCPLNFGVEDGRHEVFIENNGSKKAQEAVLNFQLELLKRRDSIMPLFQDYTEKEKLTFRLPLDEIYDLCVLEYSFAFWQWMGDYFQIPATDLSDAHLFKHMMAVSGPDYFNTKSDLLPFFVQAVREIGYYGYDTEPFAGYLSNNDAEGYIYKAFLPEEIQYEFDSTSMQRVQQYFDKNDPKMIFIYGEYDPWSASAIEFKKKKNMIKVIKKEGTHSTRIGNMPDKQKQKVIKQIKRWLEE